MIENDKMDEKTAARKAHFAELVEKLYELEQASGKGAKDAWDFFWNEIPDSDDEDELEDLDEGVENNDLEIVVEPTEKKLRKSKKSVAKPRSK